MPVGEVARLLLGHHYRSLPVVMGGAATVLGTFHDLGEELTATALAASVPGVRSVVVQPCAPSA